jgi:hypothetical protein
MNLAKGTVVYSTEDAKKKWEGKEAPQKDKKVICPSCDLEAMKKSKESSEE